MIFTEEDNKKYRAMANAIRFLSVDAVENARSGHPGMPMGIAEVATILFSNHMRINPDNPEWDYYPPDTQSKTEILIRHSIILNSFDP